MFEEKLKAAIAMARIDYRQALDLFDEARKLATTRQERERVHAEMVLLRLVPATPYAGG